MRGQPGQQGGVVARARADVEHALAAVQLQQLEHAGDDERLGDRLLGADRQRHVLPRVVAQLGRHEGLARDRADGLEHALVADVASQRPQQPLGRWRASAAPYAMLAPAARSSSSARSESPGSTSTPRTAVESTVTPKPARSASSAVFLTQ